MDTWKEDSDVLISKFIEENGLVKQQLDSYNKFVEEGLEKVINEVREINVEGANLKIRFGRLRIGVPQVTEVDGYKHPVYPYECRIRGLTYSSPLYLEVSKVSGRFIEETKEVYIGEIPVMVKSNLCLLKGKPPEKLMQLREDPLDPGGYFIINGSERVIVAHEDLSPNEVIITREEEKAGVLTKAKILSVRGGYKIPFEIERRSDGTFVASIMYVKNKVPIGVLLRALGLETDKQIVDVVSDDPTYVQEMLPTIEELQETEATTKEEALDFIGRRIVHRYPESIRIKRAMYVIDKYVLPHIGLEPENRMEKAMFIGDILRKMLDFEFKKLPEIDKDHYGNKRLLLAGDLLTSLFRRAFNSLCKDITYQIEKFFIKSKAANIFKAIKSDVITNKFNHALATGQWSATEVGISRTLDKTNYLAVLSNLRRVVSPLSRSYPHFEARELHGTHWGKLCAVETPEGHNCGLVKNLAVTCVVSVGTSPSEVIEKAFELGVIPLASVRVRKKEYCGVYCEGKLIGFTTEPKEFVKKMIHARRTGEVSSEVNVVYKKDWNEVKINCGPGRARRPLIIVEKGVPLLRKSHIKDLKNGRIKWSHLVKMGVIEYLDSDEEEGAYIAITPDELTPEHTHLEISPYSMLGVSAGGIPYSEHNAAPRNIIGANMAKQALGIYNVMFKMDMGSRSHVLNYPQAPIVKTKIQDLIKYDLRPSGQNLVVAVMSYNGYNMHDALVINKASIERGVGRSFFYRVYETEEKRYPGGQEDVIEVPSEDVMEYRAPRTYRNLGEDGVVEIEQNLEGGDVIIGKTSPPRFIASYVELGLRAQVARRDSSVKLRYGESGSSERVIFAENIDGNKVVKVKIRSYRIPEIGDKFASRHGQKGVIGLIVPQEDMPFTREGITPDLIINPHGFPSRMTIGQLIETLAGKVGSLAGRKVDGTPFVGEKEEDLRRELRKLGFKNTGREVLYDGLTGKKLEAEIFIGVCYYQKLHHMVADKIHARSTGPVQILTRQPTEGKAREGGLKFGEMERDCIIAHGASFILQDRLRNSSDNYTIYVCEKCGLMAYFDRNRKMFICPLCGEIKEVAACDTSYAFKLMLQELMSMGIKPKIICGKVS